MARPLKTWRDGRFHATPMDAALATLPAPDPDALSLFGLLPLPAPEPMNPAEAWFKALRERAGLKAEMKARALRAKKAHKEAA